DVDGLVEGAEGAGVHGQDGGGHVVVRGDHQDRHIRRVLAQFGDEVDPGHVGEPHVEDDGRRGGGRRQVEALGAGGGRGHTVAALLEVHLEQLADRSVVVDDEDLVHDFGGSL